MTTVNTLPGQVRRERAKATRRRIVDSAYRLFSEQGYPATTMEAIAGAADVAVQTVYFVFRTKSELLREVIEIAAAGVHDAPPVADRPWMQQTLASADGHRALALAVEHGVDIYARVAPLTGAIQAAAASEPDVDAYWRRIAKVRRLGMGQLIGGLDRQGQLRAQLTADRATDILFAVNSHETFLHLTRDAGWALKEFKAWLYETLCEQLLAVPRSPIQATEDLSFHDSLSGDRLHIDCGTPPLSA